MNGSVSKRRNGWYYSLTFGRVNGKISSISRKGGNTKEEAEATLKEILKQCDYTTIDDVSKDISFSDYLDLWFKDNISTTNDTADERYYKKLIETFLKPNFGYYKLKTINSYALQKFINQKYINAVSKTLIRDIYNILNNALASATEHYKFIKFNPMENVDIPGEPHNSRDKYEIKLITSFEFKKIIKHFPEGNDYFIPIQIAYNTGLRTNELCGLTWDCIDFKNKLIRVEQIVSLIDETWVIAPLCCKEFYRIIPIDDNLINILKNHKHTQLLNKKTYGSSYIDSTFVCTRSNGKLVSPRSTKSIIKTVTYELFIDISFQSFRYSYAAKLLYTAMDLSTIQCRLGYKDFTTFMHTYYSIVDKKTQSKIMQKLDSINDLTISLKN
jgi:ATP-dependent helicase/nuclease subunit A